MSLPNPIGGYFELELPRGSRNVLADAVLLNSGRHCFEYILRANQVSRVHLPKFTCDVMLEPLQRLSIPYSFYSINQALELQIDIELHEREFIVYTNYFGLKDDYSKSLSEKYKNQLILDASQAFYFEPLKVGHTFYSLRKFFGVPDGGLLYTDKLLDEELPVDTSYQRFSHLIKRIDLGAEAGYEDFKANDESLSTEPVKRMSQLTRGLMAGIDFEAARQARIDNFAFMHESLGQANNLLIEPDRLTGPMCYPYLTDDATLRQKLISNKIFVATYWPSVLEWAAAEDLERRLAQHILPLPIDQRYGRQEMERILEVING